MKPAHAHKDEKWKTGLIESPTVKGLEKCVCVCREAGRETKTSSRIGKEDEMT
jgi:hypothetical protein